MEAMPKLFVHGQNSNLVVTATNEVVADTLSKDFSAEEQREHSKCIVRACNAHDDLVKALEEITDIAEQVDSWESFPSGPIEKARAALAKAA